MQMIKLFPFLKGPPHNITLTEIQSLFGSICKIEKIDSCEYRAYNDKLLAELPIEVVYLLTKL
jgi:hypothetical protein